MLTFPPVIATKAWYSMSYSLLQDMSAHIDDTRSLMSRIDQAQDQERRVCLIYSMITCWTSVAQLHDAMALQEHDSLQLCRKAVSEVFVWTRELRDKDYFLLDPFVGVSLYLATSDIGLMLRSRFVGAVL